MFSGAGGFTAELDRNKFHVKYAIDIDINAEIVYRKNNPEVEFIRNDVKQIAFNTLKSVDMILAGPPCQGFSLAGMRSRKNHASVNFSVEDDERNSLTVEILRAVETLKPHYVIMENVPAMENTMVNINGKKENITSFYIEEMENMGYGVIDPIRINAADFGIQQSRKRLFILATLDKNVGKNELTNKIKDSFDPDMKNFVWKNIDYYAGLSLGTVPDHIGRLPNSDDLKIIHNLGQGETYRHLLVRNPEILKGRRHVIYNSTNFGDRFYRLKYGEPAKTIVAHLQKDGNSFIHPTLDRSISVKEAMIFQGFPEQYVFGISKTQSYKLIGNAVVPRVGKFLVEYITDAT